LNFVGRKANTIDCRCSRLTWFAKRVAVILSSGGDVAALSAKAATSSIPIVTVSGTDPIR